MEKPGVACMDSKHKNIWLKALFWPPLGSLGPLKPPSSKASNGRPSLPCSLNKMFYFQMISPWVLLTWKVDKGMMIWDIFWPFSGSGGPPNNPRGFQMDNLVCYRSWEVTFYYGMTQIQKNGKNPPKMMKTLKMTFFCIFMLDTGPKTKNITISSN